MDYINILLRSYMIILFTTTLPFIEGSNINCNGKAFHCVNSTHFKICVDLGGGVSTTVDEFLIPCPQNTVCKPYNLFECEYELTTTLSPVTFQSEVKKEQLQTSDNSVSEKLDMTTLFPTKHPQGMESSEKYYNKVNAKPASLTKIFLTDAVISPGSPSNQNDLHTSGNRDINENMNDTPSSDKELRFSSTESGINVTQTWPYNVDTLVTSIGVSTNYNIESSTIFSTTKDTKSMDPIKNESLEPLNKNIFDLGATLTLTKRTDQVNSVSELRYSAPVTLLPGNFSDSYFQESTLRTSNINRLIKSENRSQEPNLDLLITYNTTQLSNSDNNTQYRNTDIKTLNSTTLKVITDKIFTSDKSNINNKSKVKSAIPPASLGQHLAEITTASTIKVAGPTKQFTSNKSLNAVNATDTFLNDGLNITTNIKKLNVTDRDIMISSTIQPETSVVNINAMSNQITNSEHSVISSNKPQTSDTKSSKLLNNLNLENKFVVNPTTELNKVNFSHYLTSTEPYLFYESSKILTLSTSKYESTSPINIKDFYFSTKEATQVHKASQINDVNTMESVSVLPKTLKNLSNSSIVPPSNNSLFNKAATKFAANDKIIVGEYSFTSVHMLPVFATAEISNGVTSSKSTPNLNSKNETLMKQIIATVATIFDSNNVTTTKVSNNITAEISNGATSLKSIPDSIAKNETFLKPVITAFVIDFDNNNITTTEASNNITAEIPNEVTNLKSIPDLISKNETLLKPVMTAVATTLDNNNKTTTEVSNNIAVEKSHAATSLKSVPNLMSWPKPVMVTVVTDLDNDNITTTEESNNITAEFSNGVTNLKSMPDLISKNETLLKPIMAAIGTDLDNNNVTTTELSNNISAEIPNGVINLKSIPDLISKNETLLKPVIAVVATDLVKNNITTTEESNNITAELSNGVINLKSMPGLISKNETLLKPVMTAIGTDLDNNNVTTTELSNNITAEIPNGVINLKSIPDLISKNEILLKPVIAVVATDLDKNNITATEESNNITAELSNGPTSLKSVPNLMSWPKPVMVTVVTDLDNDNITTTEESNNITAEFSNEVTNFKSMPDLISKNETLLKPVIAVVATDLDKNKITATEESNNITAELSNGVTDFKSIPDSITKNETFLKPVMTAVAIDFDNNNITTTEASNNITAEIPNEVTNLKAIPDLISKNETLLKPVMIAVATTLDNYNITTTEASNNITAEIPNEVTNLKSIPDLISKNETLLKPVMTAVATDLDKNNKTTTEVSNNIAAEIPNGVTNLKSMPDLISKNETLLKPIMAAIGTDLDNNNVTTTELSNNISAEIPNGVINLKSIPDLISKNETLLKPVIAVVATDPVKNNITTTEESNNITAELSNGVTNLKSMPGLISKNETLLKPVMAAIGTDLDNNNITTTEESNNITAELSNGVTNLKSMPDLISKNETLLKPVMAAIGTDLDNNSVTTIELSNNITAEIPNGVTNLKSIPNLISKNETLLKPVIAVVATDLVENNITTIEESNNTTSEISNGATSLTSVPNLMSWPKPVMVTVVTDLDNDNITTTEVSNYITAEISNGVTNLKSMPDLVSKNETLLKPVMAVVATNLDKNNVTTTELSNNITTELSNGVTNLKSMPDLISKNETRPKLEMVVATDLDINNTEKTEVSNNILAATYNNYTIINSLYEINKALSPNSTLTNRTPDVYRTTTKGNTAFITANSVDATNSSFAVIDVFSENRVISDNINLENTSKLESTITATSSKYFDADTSSKPVISLKTKTVTPLSSEPVKKEMNTKQVIYKNTSNKDQILDKYSFGNQNLTKRKTENVLISKLVATNDFSLSPALNLTYTGNNVKQQSDKNNNSIKHIEVKHNQVTNSLLEKPLAVGVINTDLNFTNKNVVSSVVSYSKSKPLVYSHSSFTKPPLPNINNASHSYFYENISSTRMFDKTTVSNQYNESEDKESRQTNKNGLVPVHAISNIKHEGNKTVYLVLNPYKQVTNPAIEVNDTTLKESYNFSDPSLTRRGNVKHDFIMESITISADKNTAPKYFYGTNKSNRTTTIKTVHANNCINCSKVDGYFQAGEIPNSQLSGKPLLIVHEPLQEVNNRTNLLVKNGNLSLITEHGFQWHDSDRIYKSKISEINNKQTTNRSKLIAPVRNVTSAYIFSGNIINNWGVVNTTVGPTAIKTFIRDRNVSEVKSLSVIRTKENYTNDLNATSESSITANNLLRNTSSQTNSIKDKTRDTMPLNAVEFLRIPSEFYKSSQSTGPLKMETTSLILNTTKLKRIREQEKITTSDHTNLSKENEKKQIRNGHGSPQSIFTIGNAVTQTIRNNTQNRFTAPINNINYYAYGNSPTNQEFSCTKRGKYSDKKNCNKFYVCIGRGKPIIGVCPIDTVFSEFLKQCTKNVTHCIRNNQFKCTVAGRFINIVCNNSYFICAKKKSGFIRFTLHCQQGYYLNKNNIKCTPDLKNISISDENNSKNTKELSFDKPKEIGIIVNSKNNFECEKEGKFKDPQDCRKYYVCKKGRKTIFRRKIKKCDSDEVFHRKKKKCVDVESYECDI